MEEEVLNCTSIIEAVDYLRAKDRAPEVSLESFRESRNYPILLIDKSYSFNSRLARLFSCFVAQTRKRNSMFMISYKENGTVTQKLVNPNKIPSSSKGKLGMYRVIYGRK